MFQPPPPQPPPPMLHLQSQLSYNLHDINNPDLVWDIIHPPDYARLCDRRYFKRWILPDFDSPAFEPSVQTAWVMSDHPVLSHWISRWGPVSMKLEKITVKDLLDGIYYYLRTPLTTQDMAHIKSIPGNKDALRFARARRAKESREVEAVVIKQGYRRVDVLGGHRRFQGLRVEILPDYSWRLHLGLLPGPVTRLF
ncbi:hypothetical protein GALMADRAFT_239829 [Galerina marginata CBS 339.88]|uniref:DUF6699 domain-containing protein n=1 Tax=Galerina marginata (strain CBS 339.88) TaxID=685588 RepID=A0A067TEP5_GALM3|nr:hypothetical protein GALMADRAFT_239829 [Galerina marginata CBS 339.88]